MFKEKTNSSFTAPVKQAEKSVKQKTMATGHANSLAEIDFSKPLTDSEIVLISENNENVWESSYGYPDSISNYYPGKYQEHAVVAEPQKVEEKKRETDITSYVGDYVTNTAKNKIANLSKDVALIQEHLNRLGILSDADYLSEKPTTEGEINKSTLPKTIIAIRFFQEQIIASKTVDGVVSPGYATIKSLVPMTVEQKDTKYLEYLKNKKEQEKIVAADKAKAEKEAKIKAKEAKEKEAKENRKKEIELIDSPGFFGVQAYWLEFMSSDKFGEFLKDFALYNPKFVEAVYKYTDFYLTDNLTRSILNRMSDSEISGLSIEIDQLFYDTIKWGDVTKEERALMIKLKAGNKKKNVKFDKKTIGDANKDLNTLRNTLNNQLTGSVGAECTNYPIDVRMVANKLKEKKLNPGEKALKDGICDEICTTAIGEFQKSLQPKKKDYDPDKKIDIGQGTWKALFDEKGTYKSGIKDIHAGRSTVNLYLVDSDSKGIVDAVGDVNNKTFSKKIKNNIDDVKYISELLKNKGYSVTKKNLDDGKCDATFIAAIKSFEKAKRKTQHGVVTKDGSNIKLLQGSSIGKLTYSKGGVHDKNNTGTLADAYYDKLDVLEKNLKIEDDKDNAKVLSIARKAATDNSYFAALTKDVTSKLLLTEQNVRDNGFTLSPVLVDRMQRFHKFLSAAGLFKGDMTSSEGGGVRSEKTAHIWCGQWIIAGGASGSKSGASYIAATKKIMLEMYKEQKSNSSKFIVDIDTNKWAKKEHFTEKDGKVTMDWGKIKSYVVGINGGRNGYTSPANSGYKENLDRRPVPPKYPNRTNHRTGEALDINATAGFQNKYDSILDMIALNFGVVRSGGAPEWWHFTLTDLKLSTEEKKAEKNKTYPKLIGEK